MSDLTNPSFVTNNTDGSNLDWTPKRKNTWYADFSKSNWANGTITPLQIKSSGLPGGSFSETEIKYMNSKYYFPGIWTWDTVEMTLRDFKGYNTTQALYNAFLTHFNPVEGAVALGASIKGVIEIYILDSTGQFIEKWILNGAWISAAKWGEATYDDEQPRELTMTIRYDYATHSTTEME